jgi:hypothetical protein
MWLIVPAVFASCASMEPDRYILDGHVAQVSSRDIQLAIEAVQHRFAMDQRVFKPVYRVYVASRDDMTVYCGPHYGHAQAEGALMLRVERIKDGWRITDVQEYTPNSERLIVT